MKQASISGEGLLLSFDGPDNKERLAIRGEYPNDPISQAIFHELGLMHLIAPYLPRVITSDFPVRTPVRRLINKMYASEHRSPPTFRAPKAKQTLRAPQTNPRKALVAYSAGKDSLWNMWWAQEKYGRENVMATHISGLNRSNASRERIYAERQRVRLGFPHFAFADLHNSSHNGGYGVMRSRDMFLVGIAIPHALRFGASKIIIEGFMETQSTEPFSGQSKNMRFFNETLRELGLPVEVSWRNRFEMDVMKDLIRHRPTWVPHVCNCFSALCYQPGIRRSWQRHAPTFQLYDSQCGSCVKCRITNLGRLLHSPEMENVAKEDVEYFLRSTKQWIAKKWETHKDMIAGSFLRDYNRACRKYGFDSLKASS